METKVRILEESGTRVVEQLGEVRTAGHAREQ